MADESKNHTLELSIEFICELLLFLFPYGADQMGLAHSFWVGFGCWAIALVIAVRMFWIFPTWATRLSWLEKTLISFIAVFVFVLVFYSPVSVAYKKRNESTETKTSQPPEHVLENKPATKNDDEPPSVKPIPSSKPPKKATVSKGTSIDLPSSAPPQQNAPNGINIGRDNNGTAIVNNAPPARHLPDDRTALINCLKLTTGKFSIGAVMNNQEAYDYAQDWRDVFIKAGWEIEHTDIPIQIFMIGGGMWSGVHFDVHTPQKGSVQLIPGTPEDQASKCVLTIPIGLVGTVVAYDNIPSGSVRIGVSSHP